MKKILFCTTLAATFLFGCSSEDNIPTLPMDNGALNISASIFDNVDSKALKKGSAFVADDEIAVAIKGDIHYSPKVGKYTYSEASIWKPLTLDEKIILLDDAATVSAIYPSSTLPFVEGGIVEGQPLAAFDKWVISLPKDETSLNSANQIDYMCALGTSSGNLTNLTPKVSLSFTHIFSRISLVVNKGPKYSGKGKMTAFKLFKTAGFNAGAGKLDVWDSKATTWDNPKVDELTFIASDTGVDLNAYNSTNISEVVIAYGMLARIDDPSGIKLKIIVDGKEMEADLPLPAPDNIFIEGKNYRYTITVDGTGLTISPEVSTLDWVENVTGDFEVK